MTNYSLKFRPIIKTYLLRENASLANLLEGTHLLIWLATNNFVKPRVD